MTTNLKTRYVSSLLIGLVATLGVGTSAVAADADAAARSVRVSYADLNLATDQGIAALYSRLQAAAGSVCGPEPSAREILQSSDWTHCREDALSRAIGNVDHPGLTALYQQKTGRLSPVLVAASGSGSQ